MAADRVALEAGQMWQAKDGYTRMIIKLPDPQSVEFDAIYPSDTRNKVRRTVLVKDWWATIEEREMKLVLEK